MRLTFAPKRKARLLAPLMLGFVSLGSAPSTWAADWPHFRGPDYDGVSKETGWKANWGASGPKTAWKTSVGTGAASFVVQGSKVITTGNANDVDTVWCLDLDSGKVLWRYDFPCEFDKRMFDGGTASTPTIAGESVFNLSYDGQLQCLRLADGKEVWKVNLLEDFGGKLSRWKYSGSPLVVGNRVIVDNGGKGNSTLALDAKTGKKLWGEGDEGAGYASPIPFKDGARDAVLVFKGEAMVAHSLSDGKRLWNFPWKTSYDVNASSPTALDGGKVLVSSGYSEGRAALLQAGSGSPKKLWENDKVKTKMGSCAVFDGHVYAVSGDNDGKLMCVSLKDGKTVWEEKGFGHGTLKIADGKLVVLSEKGTLSVAAATPKGFEPTGEAQVLGNRCWVVPVLASGRILCKNNKGDVVCLDVRS